MSKNVVILDIGGVVRDARYYLWQAIQAAFDKKLGSRSPFSEKIMALKARPQYAKSDEFLRAVYAVWKSVIFEEEILNYDDPSRIIAQCEERYPLSDDLVKELNELWKGIYLNSSEAHLAEVKPVPDVAEAIRIIKFKGYRLGAFTNSISSFNTPWMKHWGLWDEFEVVLAKDEVENSKPSPDGIHAVCERMGVEPEQCYYVGDSAIDAIASRHAGCTSVLVLTGYGNEKSFSGEKPDFICKNLKEFVEKLPML